ncbi:uncharacterized homolog isoform X1 [Saccopteryx bilineata]|uniref:uncharacterized homolog isoform X1 n=1 Tax=Saccopteryx bilineata TaxID=59482 RepID=UPI00338EDC2D
MVASSVCPDQELNPGTPYAGPTLYPLNHWPKPKRRRLIFENMYLGDSHVLLNTLCCCCHRKIWLHSGEACCHRRSEPPRP